MFSEVHRDVINPVNFLKSSALLCQTCLHGKRESRRMTRSRVTMVCSWTVRELRHTVP